MKAKEIFDIVWKITVIILLFTIFTQLSYMQGYFGKRTLDIFQKIK